MIDRDKVIKGLHCCSHTDGTNCGYCPYDNTDEDCTALMSMDALALLKEQEPVIPGYSLMGKHFICPNCSLVLDEIRDYYCPSCGKKIAWDKTDSEEYD